MRKEEEGDVVVPNNEEDDDEGLEDEDAQSLSDHKDSETDDDSEEIPEVSYVINAEAFRDPVLSLAVPLQVFEKPTSQPDTSSGPPEINPGVVVDDPDKVS